MNPNMISALVVKDLSLYFRNRFFAFITVLGLVFYIGIYFFMPSQVDELLEMGLYAPNMPPALLDEMTAEGLVLIPAASVEALRQGILDGEYGVGVALAEGYAANLRAGQREEVRLLFAADLPDASRDLFVVLWEGISFTIAGVESPEIAVTEEVLGPDMVGEQIPLRDRMVSLFAVVILLMETLGLASLISSEVVAGTLRAVLVTPLNVAGLFVAKGITGVSLALAQVLLFMGVTGSLNERPLEAIALLVVGSLFVTGLAFLIASVARDMMGVMSWGVIAIVLLVLPAINLLVPGLVSQWVALMPSYYLIEPMNGVINFGHSWAEIGWDLVILTGYAAAFIGLGIFALRRKLA